MLMNLFRGNVSWSYILSYIISSLAVIFLTMPVHEFAHGFAATKLGDPTPRYQGRLTLNPFAHIDYFGALCILLFGFGWAKPVQVNARYFKNPKRDMALTAIAGPIANIIIALISLLLANMVLLLYIKANFAATAVIVFTVIRSILVFTAQINVFLAVFNIIPIPPLDGSRVLFAVLPQKYYFKFMQYERYIFIALIVLIWIGALNAPLNFLSDLIMRGIAYIAHLPFIKIL